MGYLKQWVPKLILASHANNYDQISKIDQDIEIQNL